MTLPAATEMAVLDWLAAHKDAMLDLIRDLVDIDSGSYDKAGVDAVGTRIKAFLAEHGVPFTEVSNDRFGDAIRAQVDNVAAKASNAAVLLLGHRDTVFPAGEAARRPFRIADGRGSGPGCSDMKSGVVVNAFVLAAFARFAVAPSPITALFTADEEIGSPSSKALIKETARTARAVFNSEPGRPGGGVITGRKGLKFMRMDVVGKAAHAASTGKDGHQRDRGDRPQDRQAACADGPGARHHLQRRHDLGRADGQHRRAQCDRRDRPAVHRPGAGRAAPLQAVEAIVAEANVPGTRASLEIIGEFDPMVESEASQRLYEHYAACARALGQTVEPMFAGGCSDSGFATSVGAPTICAVGPIGGRLHSPEEYLDIDTIVPRAQALALAIMRLDAA